MAIGNTTFHLVFIFQIWNDPPNGPFPNENHQVSFQQQHAYGLKNILCKRGEFLNNDIKGEVVEYANLLSREKVEVCDGF